MNGIAEDKRARGGVEKNVEREARLKHLFAAGACAALLLLAGNASYAQSNDSIWQNAIAGATELRTDLHETVVAIPLPPDSNRNTPHTEIAGTVFRPRGAGPFPLLILSHGSPLHVGDRDKIGRYRVLPQIEQFIRRGFAVLVPIRRGFGVTGGVPGELFGSCEQPRFYEASLQAARDLNAAIAFAKTLPFVNGNKIVLMGQSAGGIASLAAASRAPSGVVAVINFSGGRGGRAIDGIPCGAQALANAIEQFASTIKVPVLWHYVENDKYFGPAAAKLWFGAFEKGGGKGVLVMQPPDPPNHTPHDDGHLLFYRAAAIPVWTRAVDTFFRANGLAELAAR